MFLAIKVSLSQTVIKFTYLYINTSRLFKKHTLHLLLHVTFIHCIKGFSLVQFLHLQIHLSCAFIISRLYFYTNMFYILYFCFQDCTHPSIKAARNKIACSLAIFAKLKNQGFPEKNSLSRGKKKERNKRREKEKYSYLIMWIKGIVSQKRQNDSGQILRDLLNIIPIKKK